jgi:flavin reductase (DIM6/NTAB) family NADH-FMN oxidoreductase RutF
VTACGSASPVAPDLPQTTAEELRAVFRRHAAGVAIVTAAGGSAPVGFTATSLASVSARPPLLSFNIARTSSSWPVVSLARHVGVHVLTDRQEELAARFATTGADRFGSPTVWRPGPRRVPVLAGCAAWMVGVVEQRVAAGDHVIVVTRLLYAGVDAPAGGPLIHHDGRYLAVPPRGEGSAVAS